jgi:ABC-2 type transport system permease protein
MIRFRKIRPVAVFELVSVIRSKSWLITTFGMPVFLLMYGGLVSIPAYLAARHERAVAVYGVVVEPGAPALGAEVEGGATEVPEEVRSALRMTGQADLLQQRISLFQNYVFRPIPTEEEARKALVAGSIRAYYRIPADYVATGRIEEFSPEVADLSGSESRRALGKVLASRLLGESVPEAVAKRALAPIEETKSFVVTKDGEVKRAEGIGKFVRIVVPLAFSILLLVSILMSAGALVQATGTEKENKVVEVLLSSAGAEEILMGKLLGLGVAGVLQILVWFGMVGVAAIGFTTALVGLGVTPPWGGMVAAVLFFPLAYLFFGSLMLGTGSLGSNQREANQWGMMWSLLAVIPMMFLERMLHDPHGTIGRVLTWLPFSAPTAVVMRITMDPAGIAWWEIAGAVLVLLLSIWIAIRLSARLFRVGMLLTGARPKLREILRQARLS